MSQNRANRPCNPMTRARMLSRFCWGPSENNRGRSDGVSGISYDRLAGWGGGVY